jgi:fatty-acyl-CoA synthase
VQERSSPDCDDGGFFRGRIATIDDIRHLESVPLEKRIWARGVYDYVALAADKHPDKAAFLTLREGRLDEEPEEISYRAMLERVHRLAHLIRSLGVTRDDVVAMVLPNVTEVFWMPLAIGLAAAAFPLNWMLEAEALGRQMATAKPKLVIALGPCDGFNIWEKVCAARATYAQPPALIRVSIDGNAELAGDADMTEAASLELYSACASQPSSPPPWLDDDDAFSATALLIGTGGTTGDPKIAPITHRALAYKVWACVSMLDMRAEHRVFGAMPQFHIGGILACTLSSLAAGSTMIIPGVAGFRAKPVMRNYWKLVERFGITDLAGVPTIFTALSQMPVDADISTLRDVTLTGSAAMPVALGKYFERIAGVRILGGYGLTEYSGTVCLPPRDGDPGYGTCGIRYPYTQVKIARAIHGQDSFTESALDEPGEILVSGPGVIRGYLNPEHNSGLLVGGWLRTGDIGQLDEDGYLRITGRSKDLIIRSGHNIDPRQIEDVLLGHPDVSTAAAVGMPDAYAGELPMAFVELKGGAEADEEAILAYARSHISERAAVPAKLIIVPAMPLTVIGKIFRPELRRRAIENVFTRIVTELVEPERLEGIEVDTKGGGTLVNVRLRSGEGDADLEQRLMETFGRFTFPVHVAWVDREAG